MPGRAEKEHSSPRLCLVPVQETSKGREQSASLGLKSKFKHQEVTQMQLRKGSSCKEKRVKEREHAAAPYLLLLDPSVRARVTLENKENFKEQTSFTSSPATESIPLPGDAHPLLLGTQIATDMDLLLLGEWGQKIVPYWHSDVLRAVSDSLTARLNHPT